MNDGSFRWVAERADLLWALSELGWVREGAGAHHDHWTQPEGEGSPYNALCEEVECARGYGASVPLRDADDDLDEFLYRPDLGVGVWTLDALIAS